MVGDRFLTDVVFGNRNGMLTVRPAPFTPKGEPRAVLLVRRGGEAAAWAAPRRGIGARGCACAVRARAAVLEAGGWARGEQRLHWAFQGQGCYADASLLGSLPLALTQARAVEERFVGQWQRAGVQPPPHPLVPDAAAAAAFLRHPDTWGPGERS